ncbi:hypothetical protein PG994_007573 [Apiospora phragmitis]|uniref:Rhodopsin domain-containing protein n=1 Tax=Apiospora phragmitis TaxID=2905665 RepID=A0ABR1V179_9PEZI
MVSIPGVPPIAPEQMKDDRRAVIIHSCVWLNVVSTICLALRLLSRRIQRMRLGVDDWIVIAAQIFSYGHAAIMITSKFYFQPKCGYALAIIGVATLCLVKASVLALYLRIFPQRHIRLGVYTIGAVVAAYCLSFEIMLIFGCHPISLGWSNGTKTKCLNPTRWFSTTSTVIDTVLNVFILALPVRAIVQLHVKRWQKTAIIGLFLLAGLSTASAWVRWSGTEDYFKDPNVDQLYSVNLAVFLVLETATGVMGVCLSTITPILSYFTLRLGFKRASVALKKADVAGLVTIGGSDGSLERPVPQPESRPRLFSRRHGVRDTSLEERRSFSEPRSGTA